MRVIDVDSHVTEPPDVWTSRVSSKWGDLVPHVKWVETSALNDGKGEYAWFMGDRYVAPAYGSVFVGEEGAGTKFPRYARTPEEGHPGAWDAKERLKVMDEGGIDVQALYGNVGGFGSEGFLKLGEPELMAECIRAFNDFIADFASVEPSRYIPICVAPVWDVDFAVAEVQRCVANGHRGISFTAAPDDWGFPALVDPHWEPLWSAVEECGVPLTFHLGSGDFSKSFNPDLVAIEGLAVPYARVAVQLFFETAQQLNTLLFSGILARHPGLRFVCVESGVGWIPFLLQAADYHFIRGGVRQERPEFTELPSEYFRRQCASTFWFEELTPGIIEQVGADNILFETDFPHSTSIWREEVPQHIEMGLRGQPDDVRERILSTNAERIYGLNAN